jgi:ParB family transcriptional regulator, chromosome partitioning protein
MTRLGKGLDALIRSGPESTDGTTGITTLKIEFISPNRYQPRKFFDQEKLGELAVSLKENGIIQPIIVTKRDQTKYELVAGERRLEAAKLAGFDEVPVIIRSISLKEQLQFAIIENVQREDLNALEEAEAYHQLNDEFSMTHAQISEIVGKDRATVTNLIRLLKLDERIRQMILEGKLSPGHARAILQVKAELQNEFADYVSANKLSVRKAESAAKRINETGQIKEASVKLKKQENSSDNEKRLSERYSSKVRISQKNNKGKISFYFDSGDEFAELLSKFDNLK